MEQGEEQNEGDDDCPAAVTGRVEGVVEGQQEQGQEADKDFFQVSVSAVNVHGSSQQQRTGEESGRGGQVEAAGQQVHGVAGEGEAEQDGTVVGGDQSPGPEG